MGDARRSDPQDAKAAGAGRVDQAPGRPRLASSPGCSRPSPTSISHSAWRGTIADGSGSPRAPTIPTPSERDGQGRDRISILEDTNGDGRADSFKVFAEGLNIPTSLLCHDGGVIVLQAPDTLFLKDTDGDGKADLRKVLFTGWGIGDTHAGPSNLRWGLDNWVWGIVGYSAFRGTVGGEAHSFGQGLFRFKPDGSKLEFIAQHEQQLVGRRLQRGGAGFRLDGQRLPERLTCRSQPLLRSGAGPGAGAAREHRGVEPVLSGHRQGASGRLARRFHGGGRACPLHGPDLPAALLEPDRLRGRADRPLGRDVHARAQGSDVADYYGWNLVASDDEWTAPINAEVGPDGHVWVIDWYNYIVQHNPTPHGFKTGKGNAYETPLRDKTHGRIYRIVYKDAEPSRPPRTRSRPSRRAWWRLCGMTISSGGCTPSGFWSSGARPTSCPR